MKTYPDMSFEEHIKRWIDYQISLGFVAKKSEVFLYDYMNAFIKDDKWCIKRSDLYSQQQFSQVFQRLCDEGREWINLSGGGMYNDCYVLSVEYSQRPGFSVVAINLAGFPIDWDGKPSPDGYVNIIEE